MNLLWKHIKDNIRVLRYNGIRGWKYRPALWETRAYLEAVRNSAKPRLVDDDEN